MGAILGYELSLRTISTNYSYELCLRTMPVEAARKLCRVDLPARERRRLEHTLVSERRFVIGLSAARGLRFRTRNRFCSGWFAALLLPYTHVRPLLLGLNCLVQSRRRQRLDWKTRREPGC
jgi:hypothetical protein